MLLYAIDYNGKSVHAADAIPGFTYFCPYCGAKVFVKSSINGNPFFACYPHERHTSERCEYISQKSITRRIIYTIKKFDPEQFFENLFRRTPEGPSTPGPGYPPTSPPEGGGTPTIDIPPAYFGNT